MKEAKILYDMVITGLSERESLIEEEVEQYIKMVSSLPIFSILNEENIEDVRKKVISKKSIKLAKGFLIQDKKHERWFLNRKSKLEMAYWERYKKYLLQHNGFSPNVVNTMDDVLDNITDLLGDPSQYNDFQRRGLVIGDVQSGKTANYTGLICKAADAGYKVIVLLTGTIEKLRRQTQFRLDEGFVGRDSEAMIKLRENEIYVGVGKYDSSLNPMALTSTVDDFKQKNATNLGFSLENVNVPVLFVIKKNVSILKRLNKWLVTLNDGKNNKIAHSLLMIDDESDNASINTNPEDRDPTATNKTIREILYNFQRASYIGFTATPYANIFIDPDTDEQMKKEDLFPRDYIYALDSPSNYIGARQIFDEQGLFKYMLKPIDNDDIDEYIPRNHKIDHMIEDLPKDLKEAISTFLVANAVRDLRGDKNSHRSMIINVSRFVAVQNDLELIVKAELKNIQSAVRLFYLQENEAQRDFYIRKLKEAYDDNYSDIEYDWNEILLNLHEAIAPVKVIVVNQKSKAHLNYDEYKNDGLRVIAIGGISLSRGLTLEGLMTTYFYRNSKTYDTLMQMGRWFGYREKYADLCRIWMSNDSIGWYKDISEATDELKRDVKAYQDTGLTPLDFGLRVRSDITTLLVTARNKMRSASDITISTSLSGELLETTDIFTDPIKNENNHKTINNLIEEIHNSGGEIYLEQREKSRIKKYGYINVNKKLIVDFLKDYEVTLTDTIFNTNVLSSFIKNYAGHELDKWDISFPSGSSPESVNIGPDHSIKRIRRAYSNIGSNLVRMSGSKKRLGTVTDGEFRLTSKIIKELKAELIVPPKKSLSQKDYFRTINRNPLLSIYFVELNNEEKEKSLEKNEVNGISIGIPRLTDVKTKYAKYVINKVYKQKLEKEEYDIGEEE